MNLKESLSTLESLGNEKTRTQNIKRGGHDNQFGVKLGDIRKIAKKIKTNHNLALELWKTENTEARLPLQASHFRTSRCALMTA